MGTEFRMDSIPGSLVVVGGVYEHGSLYWSRRDGAVPNVQIYVKLMRYFQRLVPVLEL